MQVGKFWKMCSAGNLDFARVNNLGASERGAQGDLLTSESKSAAGQSWRRAAILIQHNNCFWKLAILNVTTEHFQDGDTTPPSKPHKPRQPRGDTFPHVVAVSREQSKLSDYPDQVASNECLPPVNFSSRSNLIRRKRWHDFYDAHHCCLYDFDKLRMWKNSGE